MTRPSMLLLCALSATAAAQENFDAFSRRVADYVKLHNLARSEIHGLKPTRSTEAIDQYEHRLGHRIREAREGVGPGNIFTPEIAAEFRKRIAAAVESADGLRIRASLRHGSPVHLKSIRVNASYPSWAALQSTPPSLLLNLPHLPPEVEYRVVGNTLILRDVDANLIVDYLPNAIS